MDNDELKEAMQDMDEAIDALETEPSKVLSTKNLSWKLKELRKLIAEMNRHIEYLKMNCWQSDDLADARKHRDSLVKAMVELTEDRDFSSI